MKRILRRGAVALSVMCPLLIVPAIRSNRSEAAEKPKLPLYDALARAATTLSKGESKEKANRYMEAFDGADIRCTRDPKGWTFFVAMSPPAPGAHCTVSVGDDGKVKIIRGL